MSDNKEKYICEMCNFSELMRNKERHLNSKKHKLNENISNSDSDYVTETDTNSSCSSQNSL